METASSKPKYVTNPQSEIEEASRAQSCCVLRSARSALQVSNEGQIGVFETCARLIIEKYNFDI